VFSCDFKDGNLKVKVPEKDLVFYFALEDDKVLGHWKSGDKIAVAGTSQHGKRLLRALTLDLSTFAFVPSADFAKAPTVPFDIIVFSFNPVIKEPWPIEALYDDVYSRFIQGEKMLCFCSTLDGSKFLIQTKDGRSPFWWWSKLFTASDKTPGVDWETKLQMFHEFPKYIYSIMTCV
jgi:hypothetical protein